MTTTTVYASSDISAETLEAGLAVMAVWRDGGDAFPANLAEHDAVTDMKAEGEDGYRFKHLPEKLGKTEIELHRAGSAPVTITAGDGAKLDEKLRETLSSKKPGGKGPAPKA